jgi:hypothetical protein
MKRGVPSILSSWPAAYVYYFEPRGGSIEVPRQYDLRTESPVEYRTHVDVTD